MCRSCHRRRRRGPAQSQMWLASPASVVRCLYAALPDLDEFAGHSAGLAEGIAERGNQLVVICPPLASRGHHGVPPRSRGSCRILGNMVGRDRTRNKGRPPHPRVAGARDSGGSAQLRTPAAEASDLSGLFMARSGRTVCADGAAHHEVMEDLLAGSSTHRNSSTFSKRRTPRTGFGRSARAGSRSTRGLLTLCVRPLVRTCACPAASTFLTQSPRP